MEVALNNRGTDGDKYMCTVHMDTPTDCRKYIKNYLLVHKMADGGMSHCEM